jgi:hypothetical protein
VVAEEGVVVKVELGQEEVERVDGVEVGAGLQVHEQLSSV